MKIVPFGRGRVFELWDDRTWSNGSRMVLNSVERKQFEQWCRKSRIQYSTTGNTVAFYKDEDVTAFMLRWS